jgi:bromodomain-containing factor 1
MVEIQKQIAALTAEAMSLTQGSAAVAAATAPKSKKSAKSKASGSSKAKRHSTGTAPVAAIKSAAPKKRVKKPRKLTLEQKREVSDAIQTLNEGEMRKAVQIIRNGVPALRVSCPKLHTFGKE